MLFTIEDSEDELSVSPLRPSNGPSPSISPLRGTTGVCLGGGPATASTAKQLRAAAADLFNASNGESQLDLHSPTSNLSFVATAMGAKRRKTEDLESKRFRDNMVIERSHSSGAAGGTQLARENVLLPDDTQATIQYSTSEGEILLQEASRLETASPSQGHPPILDQAPSPQQNPSSSSIPWSIDVATGAQIHTSSTELQSPSDQHTPSLPKAQVKETEDFHHTTQHEEPCTIGLPEELYIPRPSRSRSAQVNELTVERSISPGKAARKKKRRNLTDFDTGEDQSGELNEELKRRAVEARKDDSSASKRSSAVSRTEQTAVGEDDRQLVNQPELAGINLPEQTQQQLLATTTVDSRPDIPSQTSQQSNVQVVIPRHKPETYFATPTLPASATKRVPNSSSRRSHTTIFEDHVGLDERPDPSPNLRQQQAVRKRGRGRPKKTRPDEGSGKAAVTTQGKVTMVEEDEDLLAFSVANVSRDDTAVVQQDATTAAAPQARRRGRPRKEVAPPDNGREITAQTASNGADDRGTGKENTSLSDGGGKTGSDRACIGRAETPVREVEDPVRAAETPTSAETPDPRPTHSPIRKTTLAANYRVGLSKRQRIQPLLRICKR